MVERVAGRGARRRGGRGNCYRNVIYERINKKEIIKHQIKLLDVKGKEREAKERKEKKTDFAHSRSYQMLIAPQPVMGFRAHLCISTYWEFVWLELAPILCNRSVVCMPLVLSTTFDS